MELSEQQNVLQDIAYENWEEGTNAKYQAYQKLKEEKDRFNDENKLFKKFRGIFRGLKRVHTRAKQPNKLTEYELPTDTTRFNQIVEKFDPSMLFEEEYERDRQKEIVLQDVEQQMDEDLVKAREALFQRFKDKDQQPYEQLMLKQQEKNENLGMKESEKSEQTQQLNDQDIFSAMSDQQSCQSGIKAIMNGKKQESDSKNNEPIPFAHQNPDEVQILMKGTAFENQLLPKQITSPVQENIKSFHEKKESSLFSKNILEYKAKTALERFFKCIDQTNENAIELGLMSGEQFKSDAETKSQVQPYVQLDDTTGTMQPSGTFQFEFDDSQTRTVRAKSLQVLRHADIEYRESIFERKENIETKTRLPMHLEIDDTDIEQSKFNEQKQSFQTNTNHDHDQNVVDYQESKEIQDMAVIDASQASQLVDPNKMQKEISQTFIQNGLQNDSQNVDAHIYASLNQQLNTFLTQQKQTQNQIQQDQNDGSLHKKEDNQDQPQVEFDLQKDILNQQKSQRIISDIDMKQRDDEPIDWCEHMANDIEDQEQQSQMFQTKIGDIVEKVSAKYSNQKNGKNNENINSYTQLIHDLPSTENVHKIIVEPQSIPMQEQQKTGQLDRNETPALAQITPIDRPSLLLKEEPQTQREKVIESIAADEDDEIMNGFIQKCDQEQ